MKTDHYLDTGQMRNFLEVDGFELPGSVQTVLRNRQLGPNGTRLGVKTRQNWDAFWAVIQRTKKWSLQMLTGWGRSVVCWCPLTAMCVQEEESVAAPCCRWHLIDGCRDKEHCAQDYVGPWGPAAFWWLPSLHTPAEEALSPSAIPGISSEWSECHFAGHCADGVLKEHMLTKWI